MFKVECCIGGLCREHLQLPHLDLIDTFKMVSDIQIDDIARKVCFPSADGRNNPFAVYEATRGQAVKMLEVLRDTGVVDWFQAMAPSEQKEV